MDKGGIREANLRLWPPAPFKQALFGRVQKPPPTIYSGFSRNRSTSRFASGSARARSPFARVAAAGQTGFHSPRMPDDFLLPELSPARAAEPHIYSVSE